MPSRTRPRRWRRRAALGGLVGVLVLALAILGLGALRGWFDPGSVRGTTEGFEPEAAPTGDPDAASWPEYGHDAQRTRANPALDLAPPFDRAWRHDAGSLLEFPPVLAGGAAVVGTNAGRAIALDARTGAVRWDVALRGRVAAAPAIAPDPGGPGDLALFATLRGDLVALDLASGEERWRYATGSSVESSPLVADRSAYIGTLDGRVLRVSLATRRAVWEARANGGVKASLALSGPNVVVGDYGGRITAFARASGRMAWQTASPGPRLGGSGRFYAGPAVAYGRVFLGNINGYMLALAEDTGEVAWTRTVGDYIYSSAAVAGRTVYVGSYDHGLYALDAVTGEVRWRFDAGERISGSPSVIGGVVYVSTLARPARDGRTFGLDADTGERLLTFPDGRYSPAVAVEDLLVLTGVRTLYGLVPRGRPATPEP